MYFYKKIVIVFFLIFSSFSNIFSQNTEIDSLLQVLKTANNDTNKVNLLYNISKKYLYNAPDKAMEYNSSSIALADKLDFKKGKANAYDISGIYHQNKGEYDKAEKFYRKSLNIRKELEKQTLIAISYNNFGVLNRKKGSYKEAEKYFFKALEINKAQNNTLSLSQVYNNLGLLMDNLGKYQESIEYHFKSLELREILGNKRNIASSLNNIGIVFIAIDKFDEALKYLFKSLKIKKELGNKKSLASTYLNIGQVKFYQEEFQEAIEFHFKSLEIYEQLDDKQSIAIVLSNMAYIARKNGDFEKAISYNLKSIEILKILDSKSGLCDAYKSIAHTYLEINDLKKANKYAILAKQIAIKNNIQPSVKDILNLLYEIKTSQGNFKEANAYLLQYMELDDSLFNEKTNQQIYELETKYETEKKEQKIIQLSKEKKISELKNQRSKYILFSLIFILFGIVIFSTLIFRQNKLKIKHKSLELEQKLLRTQMNPHFIFNSISAIQNFIITNEPLEASSYLSDFAKLMRATLTNSSENFISLDNEIETIENYLKLQHLRLSEKFDYKIIVSDKIDTEEYSVPPMLLQPFVENSIIHAFTNNSQKKGLITVSYKIKDKQLFVETKDNGIGIKNAEKNKKPQHSSKATDITNQRIELLSKNYKQKIDFEIIDLKDNDNKPTGTLVRFILPIKFI